MKQKGIILIIGIVLLVNVNPLFSINNKPKNSTNSVIEFPDSLECEVKPYYRFRKDGKAGREVVVLFKAKNFKGKGIIQVDCIGKTESTLIETKDGIKQYSILLPEGVGLTSSSIAVITLQAGNQKIQTKVTVPSMRQWTVFIYPHSHVDIGYTNTQANVEIIHKRNLINGIELARKTASYPQDSRYLWNPEVIWPVERYLSTATTEQKDNIIEAIQKGYLHLDAGYVHVNTSSSADEELFEFFSHAKKMEELTSTKIETLVQVDIPGMSWGIVPVASKLGIKYCLALNNGSDRVGLSTNISFKPFWWLGQDGKSKILFLQPGNYTPGAHAKGFAYWPSMAGQTDPDKLIQIVKTDNPRNNFVDKYLFEKLNELEKVDYYPYDIFPMTWAMADNTPIDADLPDAVKSWNEEYAFPHLVIASATQIMRTFDEKYGNQLPVLQGDFTEYWTDGLGTAAKQTGMNRVSKEQLIQSQTLSSMLQNKRPTLQSDFYEAWRNVTMGTEHTWCFMNPDKQPINDDILKVKFAFFDDAKRQSQALLAEALSSVTDSSSSILGVYNTLSWEHSGLVYVPEKQSKTYNSIYNSDGKAIVSQRLSTGELVFMAENIPALGSKKYYLRKAKKKFKGTFIQGKVLNNGITKIEIDSLSGNISKLTLDGYNFVDANTDCAINSYNYILGKNNNAVSVPQYAINSTNCEIKSNESIKLSRPIETKIRIKENGPLISSFLIESKVDGCKWLKREVALISGMQHVEITNTIDKINTIDKEGIHFGFGFNVPKPVTKVDIPWGIMELEKDQLAAGNRNWITFQRWLDISNNNIGITFCSLDAPVFESGNITANIVGSATNSPEWIRKLQPSATIYSWALNNHWHTNFPLSQEGVIQFRYRLLPHSKPYNPVFSNRFGMEQAQPLLVSTIKPTAQFNSPFKIEGSPNILLSVFKSSNDGKSVLLRLRSISDKDESVTIKWQNPTPKLIKIGETENENKEINIQKAILVPAMGFTTINAYW